MSEAEGKRALARDDLSPSALRIGGFPDGSGELLYDMRESLITIAPSGSGKSQAHVLRNLLYLEAPAVVLDIKGEMSSGSRHWREGVGKTYVFSPREPDISFLAPGADEFVGGVPAVEAQAQGVGLQQPVHLGGCWLEPVSRSSLAMLWPSRER